MIRTHLLVVLFLSVLGLAYSVDFAQLKDQIHQYVQHNKDVLTPELQKWIQLGSLPGEETPVQQRIADKLNELGMVVDLWSIHDEQLMRHPYFISPRSNFETSPNVVGVLLGSKSGLRHADVSAEGSQQVHKEAKSVILNGHVDVVPVGDPTTWTDDPFSGKFDNKTRRVYGRGSTDMKGGIFSSYVAIHALKNMNITLKGDVIFQSVVEEESGGAGTLAMILRGYKADAAIIPEPTHMKIFPKQQGSMWFRINVKGVAAHGGTRYEGVSAIEKSVLVIQAIQDLENVRNVDIKQNDVLYQNVTIPIPINIGTISGGKWPSSVPDLVEITGRMGVSPYETIENAQKEMVQKLESLKAKDDWFVSHPVELEWYGARWLPGNVDMDHPIVRELVTSYSDVLGQDPILQASPWGTDGGLLTNLADTPSVIFGPGYTPVAHQADEYVEMDLVYECAEVIALTLAKWCGVEE